MSTRTLFRYLRSLRLHPRWGSKQAGERRATVRDLAHHCTDKEIAAFTWSTEGTVRKDRMAIAIRKYASDHYIRPAA